MRPLAAICLAMLWLVSLPGWAVAADVAIGDAHMAFDPGQGFCALEPDVHDFDRQFFAFQQQENAGRNAVLAIYMDCDALAGNRDGHQAESVIYGILMSPLIEDELELVPVDSRQTFIAEMARLLDQQHTDVAESLQDRIDAAIAEMEREADTPVVSAMSSVQLLGLLKQDEAAAYSGVLVGFDGDEASRRIAGVTAITIVHGYIVQYALYDQFVDNGTISALLALLTPVATDLAAANPGVPVQTATAPDLSEPGERTIFEKWQDRITWDRVRDAAIVGALVAVFIILRKRFGRRARREAPPRN